MNPMPATPGPVTVPMPDGEPYIIKSLLSAANHKQEKGLGYRSVGLTLTPRATGACRAKPLPVRHPWLCPLLLRRFRPAGLAEGQARGGGAHAAARAASGIIPGHPEGRSRPRASQGGKRAAGGPAQRGFRCRLGAGMPGALRPVSRPFDSWTTPRIFPASSTRSVPPTITSRSRAARSMRRSAGRRSGRPQRDGRVPQASLPFDVLGLSGHRWRPE